MNPALVDGFLGELWIAQHTLTKTGIALDGDLPGACTSPESSG